MDCCIFAENSIQIELKDETIFSSHHNFQYQKIDQIIKILSKMLSLFYWIQHILQQHLSNLFYQVWQMTTFRNSNNFSQHIFRHNNFEFDLNIFTIREKSRRIQELQYLLHQAHQRIAQLEKQNHELRKINAQNQTLGNKQQSQQKSLEQEFLLLQDIRTWSELEKIDELELGLSEIEVIPKKVCQLEKLVCLSLESNLIRALPENLGCLKKLKKLFIYKNFLTSLPQSICYLTQLRIINASNNKLTHLPQSIGCLRSLQQLRAQSNQLSHLPESLGILPQLTILNVSENKLQSLPDSLGLLRELAQLYIYENQLSHLPQSLGNLTKLTDLNVRDNFLLSLPQSFGRLSKLQILWLYHNPQLTPQYKPISHLKELIKLGADLQFLPEPHTYKKPKRLEEFYIYYQSISENDQKKIECYKEKLMQKKVRFYINGLKQL